jgi:ABC-type dipeptide/oligopeptide/nickel transport system permease component
MSLTAFIIRRLLWTVPVLLCVMLATFALLRGAGGSPFRPPPGYSGVPAPLQRELSDFYHLDDPWFVEFGMYVKNVATLNFGPSMVVRGEDVTDVIKRQFPITLQLVGLAALVSLPLGVGLGVLAARRANSWVDMAVTSASSLLLVVPVFFLSYVLSRYLVLEWHLFPLGWDTSRSKVLPTLTLALAPTGYIARLIRVAVVETLQEDYVRTAHAKGLLEHRIIWVHVLRNSLVPFLSSAVSMLALLVTGSFFVERSFRVPGASSAFLDAAFTRDYPLLMGLTVVLAVIVLLANLVADVLLAIVDPRVRDAMRR